MVAKAGGCIAANPKELSTHHVKSLAQGTAHTVLIQIGRCDDPRAGFPFAVVVRIDGEIAIWGGLHLKDVPKFTAEITAEAIERWGHEVVIEDDVDLTGNIVVPCPPPKRS